MKTVIGLVVLIGCGEPPPPTGSTATASAVPVASVTSVASASTTVSAAPNPKLAAKETAIAFLKATDGKAELPMAELKRFTEDDDPNKLLGRPNQYLEKISWKVGGNDATIEIYGALEDAKTRAEYVRAIGAKSSLLLQYVYLNERRFAVVRIPHQVKPSDAAKWEKLVADL